MWTTPSEGQAMAPTSFLSEGLPLSSSVYISLADINPDPENLPADKLLTVSSVTCFYEELSRAIYFFKGIIFIGSILVL